MIGLVGVAVDFGIWNQTNSALSVAANVAAISAVRIAANAQVANDTSAATEGIAAGDQYFTSAAGLSSGKVGTEGVTLTPTPPLPCTGGVTGKYTCIIMGTTVTASVAYTGKVPSVFGLALFGLQSYQITGSATAVVTTAPYLNVMMMLDDSSSMQIGATNSDIQTMQTITPCNQVPSLPVTTQAPGASYSGANGGGLASQPYTNFTITGYDGGIIPAVVSTPTPPPMLPYYANFLPGNTGAARSCSPYGTTDNGKTYPNPGAPCAFACHFTKGAAGTTNDYYGLARSTIGKSNQVTLRFDLVKQATDNVIAAMQADNIATINNLQVGIYSFQDTTTRAYPDAACGSGQGCEAGNSWTTALSDVGGPASFPNGADTGIQPSLTTAGASDGNTNFDQDMTQLQGMVTPSGDGTTSQSPRKVLFLVTDGMCDGLCSGSKSRAYLPINPADCATFKNPPYNYTVYVVYTPYYPLMNAFYIDNLKQYAEPATGSPVYNAMQACASTPEDFISAADATTLNNALQKFLKQALNSPARFTQ